MERDRGEGEREKRVCGWERERDVKAVLVLQRRQVHTAVMLHSLLPIVACLYTRTCFHVSVHEYVSQHSYKSTFLDMSQKDARLLTRTIIVT